MCTVILRSRDARPSLAPCLKALGLPPGSRLQASIDPQGCLVPAAAPHEPQELFSNRPVLNPVLSPEAIERAIAKAVYREHA